MTKILIVDDEPGLLLGLRDQLEMEGNQVVTAADGDAGLAAAAAHRPDLIILDLMLPRRGGLEVCKELRRSGCRVPILMLTARHDEIDKLLGLELGADDYVTKPFSLREVCARVKAILRRTEAARDDARVDRLEFGDVALDFRKYEARKGGRPVELTPREFRILQVFAGRPGEVISRDDFLEQVWGEEVYITNRTVDNQIFSIRKKLEDHPDAPRFILSIRGAGYKLAVEGSRQ
jgi:DNA-binding response OmpR family regulator